MATFTTSFGSDILSTTTTGTVGKATGYTISFKKFVAADAVDLYTVPFVPPLNVEGVIPEPDQTALDLADILFLGL